MIRYRDHTTMGRGIHGWLDSHFHFSFADYYNQANMNFGVLRVLNDDIVQPGQGFDTHPHRDMEIVSYVVESELTHADSMGNKRSLTKGQSQYMSAGTGIFHSEYNLSSTPLRFLQVWVLPDKNGYTPNYGDVLFNWSARLNRWMPIASGSESSEAPIRIHADASIYASEITDGGTQKFFLDTGRQAYLVLVEGAAEVCGQSMVARDAMEIVEQDIEIKATDTAHVFLIEMRRE